jgi:Cytidylate kinase-like family
MTGSSCLPTGCSIGGGRSPPRRGEHMTVARGAASYYAGKEAALDRCRAYVLAQLVYRKRPARSRGGPAVTVSYEAGTGAHELAPRLAQRLQQSEPRKAIPWTVFDRQLIDQVLAEHHLPKELGSIMPEERRSYIQEVLEDQMGIRPPSWVLAPKIAETVLHLVSAGHVIVVGRGANIITQRMPNVFHVRLIGSLPQRIERMRQMHGVSATEAAKLVQDEDQAHRGYAQAHFHIRPGDDHLYHLILNTDDIPVSEAARMIADAAHGFFRRRTSRRAP